MKKLQPLLFILITFFGGSLLAQQEESKNWLSIDYGFASGKYQPFWLRSNQYGTIPAKGSFMQVGAGYVQPYKRNSKRIKIGYGADVRFLVGTDQSALLIPELYVKSKWGIFELWGGMRRQVYGLVDSTLSSGSFAWSGNSLPMPKVELVVPEWYYPGFLGGRFAFKGSFAHGWFENKREDVSHFFLHQKSFYGQYGTKNAPVKLFAGFNHQVQWGGKLLYDDPDNQIGFNGKIPTTFRDYFYVVTGITMGSNDANLQTNGWNDARNRAGNHLGTIDIGAEITIGNVNVLGYRQSYYEDGSLFNGNSISDGQHGVAIHSKSKSAFRKIVFEYFNSTSQGGAIGSGSVIASQRGLDNYFNNGAYTNGWTYRKRSMGNPFMTLDSETDLNPSDRIYFDNNRVEAFYVASEWNIGDANVIFKGSLANAIGWYGSEYIPVKKMYSLAVFVQKPVVLMRYNATLKTRLGYDHSEWYPNTLGLHVGLSMPLY